MRRKDRKVTDPAKIREIIRNCHCCRLGLRDGERVYIVPLNFGVVEGENGYVFYFHSAREGRKLDLISGTGYAAFEMDTNYQLNEGNSPCAYSARFQSIFGEGRTALVEAVAEKEAALSAIMSQATGRSEWAFRQEMLDTVQVIRLDVETLSCKEHL